MPSEHQEGVDQLIKKRDESMIEPKTYENLLEDLNSSTPIHKRGQGRTSQPYIFKRSSLIVRRNGLSDYFLSELKNI